MHRTHSKFLAISFVAVLVLGAYSYFYNDIKSEASSNSSLSSSLNTTNTSLVSTSAKITEDTAFLMKLVSLTQIKIDTSLFTNRGFNALINNNMDLGQASYGRINPFSPVGGADNAQVAKPVALVRTSPAILVTANSAILVGSIVSATSNNIYFDYGPIPTFGKQTPKVTPSLIGGDFSFKITGLNTKTNYFFRSTALINGVLVYGEVMSFSTN